MQLQMIANNHKHFFMPWDPFFFFSLVSLPFLFLWHLICSFLWPYVSAFFLLPHLFFFKNSFWLLFLMAPFF